MSRDRKIERERERERNRKTTIYNEQQIEVENNLY
jgi:hypothetical protein